MPAFFYKNGMNISTAIVLVYAHGSTLNDSYLQTQMVPVRNSFDNIIFITREISDPATSAETERRVR